MRLKIIILITLFLMLIFSAFLSLWLGILEVDFLDIVKIVLSNFKLFSLDSTSELQKSSMILNEIRIPRILGTIGGFFAFIVFIFGIIISFILSKRLDILSLGEEEAKALGANLLLLVDSINRNYFSVEVPLGILMSFVGVPIFIIVLLGARKNL